MLLPPATRSAGLAQMQAFVPRAGLAYARNRNLDVPGHRHVSGLSPYLRHRMITEPEVLRPVLNAHGATAAAKFIDEVYWRSYWKGWLEMRPGAWADYKQGLSRALDQVQTQGGLRRSWEAACSGQTGIEGFDDWAQELATTGYMHNHARMWFASIWIFTLRLPWELGADFFLRHLLDGDPASNTLGWRWVGGLQTPGKTYLARTDNIAKNTQGRFAPSNLAPSAPAPRMAPHPPPLPPRADEQVQSDLRTGLLITEEDLSADWVLPTTPAATVAVQTTGHRSPLMVAPLVTDWVRDAIEDAAARLEAKVIDPDQIVAWAQDTGLEQVAMAYPPTGPTQDALRDLGPSLANHNIRLVQRVRPQDEMAWPKATHGFFRFRESIPRLLASL